MFSENNIKSPPFTKESCVLLTFYYIKGSKSWTEKQKSYCDLPLYLCRRLMQIVCRGIRALSVPAVLCLIC